MLCVTHLAQVAACAHQQLVVNKQSSTEGTSSRVQAAEGDARDAEIARMLGGDPQSAATLAIEDRKSVV